MPRNRRRVLIVLNCGLSAPSDMVRAIQYEPYFRASCKWQAEYVSRQSVELDDLVNRIHRAHIPLHQALVNRSVRVYQRHWETRKEDAIVRRASWVDLVYLIKTPPLPIYRKLKALDGPKVVMEVNDGLWLPFFKKHGWRD